MNSSNGCKTSASGKISTKGKTVSQNSSTGKFVEKVKTEKSISKADQLTLRAWGKAFENRKKVV